MKVGETVGAVATWKFVARDAETGEVVNVVERKNVLTTEFKNLLAQAWGNSQGSSNWMLVLGTGSGTPSESDTGLFSPVAETAKTGQLTVSNNTVQYYVRYMPEDANGYTYTEAGIYEHTDGNDYTTGTLFNHVNIDPAITKDNTILLDIYVTITFP